MAQPDALPDVAATLQELEDGQRDGDDIRGTAGRGRVADHRVNAGSKRGYRAVLGLVFQRQPDPPLHPHPARRIANNNRRPQVTQGERAHLPAA